MGNPPIIQPPAQVLELLLRLAKAGHEAFLVGGALRDVLLGRSVQDWDIATSASPSEVCALFPKVILTGARHGTVTVRLDGLNIEVTTFRGNSLMEDLSHRDFTMDAMAYDPHTCSLLDPHNGRADLEARLLRGVGEASQRIAEDPLRALRAVRLAAELGLDWDQQLLSALKEAGPGLRKVALERIKQELERILLVPRPSGSLELLMDTGLMREILPELKQPESQAQLSWLFKTVDLVPGRAALRWAALLLGLEKDYSSLLGEGPKPWLGSKAKEVLLRLRASRKQAEHTARIIHHHVFEHLDPGQEGRVRTLIFQAGTQVVEDAILLRKASLQAAGARTEVLSSLEKLLEKVREILSDPEALRKMRPVLTGRDVMEILGLSSGPRVGQILAQMQKAVLLEPHLNQKEALSRFLLEKMGSLPKSGSPVHEG